MNAFKRIPHARTWYLFHQTINTNKELLRLYKTKKPKLVDNLRHRQIKNRM